MDADVIAGLIVGILIGGVLVWIEKRRRD